MGTGTLGVKTLQTFIYGLGFLASALILGIYSYFLAAEHNHGATIPTAQRAVEGISGAGALYTIFAIVLTCFLGGFALFAFIGIILDLLFMGGFIAIAILTRDGASSCKGSSVKTPLGTGAPDQHIGRDGKSFTPTLHTACRLETACFAVSLLGALIFALAAITQLWLGRRHQRDKHYGPSPANNYTSGRKRGGFFRRNRHSTRSVGRDPEVGALATAPAAVDGRNSYATATTDSYVGNKYDHAQYATDHPAAPVGVPEHAAAGGYHTAPVGTGVHQYGYENPRSHDNRY